MDTFLIPGTKAAELIGVSPPTFYKLAKDEPGLAPMSSMGETSVWSLSDVLAWIEKRDREERNRRAALLAEWRGAIDGVNPQ